MRNQPTPNTKLNMFHNVRMFYGSSFCILHYYVLFVSSLSLLLFVLYTLVSRVLFRFALSQLRTCVQDQKRVKATKEKPSAMVDSLILTVLVQARGAWFQSFHQFSID